MEEEMLDNQHESTRNSKMARLGAAVTLICILTGVANEAFGHLATVQQWRVLGLASCLFLGAVLLCVRMRSYYRLATADQVLRFYYNPHFWGVVLALTAVGTAALLPFTHPLKTPVVAARPISRPAPAPAAPPLPPEFPELRISGVTVNGTRSTALINGSTVMVGEYVAGVQLVAVTATNVTAKMGDQTRDYSY